MEYKAIQNEVIELLTDYGINRIPIDVELLMDKMGIIRVPYRELSDRGKELSQKCAKDGFYDFDADTQTFYIYYDGAKGKKRLKFTFGHEIRHIIHMDRYEDDDIRAKANYFSRFLLVPVPLLIETGVTNESELVYIFDVSPDVAKYSLDFLAKYKKLFLSYTKNEKELLELYSDEIKRCKNELIDYRERMNIPDFFEDFYFEENGYEYIE